MWKCSLFDFPVEFSPVSIPNVVNEFEKAKKEKSEKTEKQTKNCAQPDNLESFCDFLRADVCICLFSELVG